MNGGEIRSAGTRIPVRGTRCAFRYTLRIGLRPKICLQDEFGATICGNDERAERMGRFGRREREGERKRPGEGSGKGERDTGRSRLHVFLSHRERSWLA